MPRLGTFWKDHPEVQLSLLPSSDLVDLRRDDIDVAIRFGRGEWPPYKSVWLADGNLIAVGAERFVPAKPFTSFTDLTDLPWVLSSGWKEQDAHFANHGIDTTTINCTLFPTTVLALSAARSGLGVTLSTVANLERDLTDGTLHRLFDLNDSDLGYYLVTHADRDSPKPGRISELAQMLRP